jgi:small subunit ribosomal protein S5
MSKPVKNNSRGGFKERPQMEYEQKIVDLARVTRVMAGGKRMRFRAAVVLGDKRGKVGWGLAKGADVAIAVGKAVAQAQKSMIKIRFVEGTIPHQIEVKFKAARIMLKPAVKGTGIIAGGAVRSVLELVGIPNIYSKILSKSSNKISNIQATFKALQSLQYQAEDKGTEIAVGEAVEPIVIERDLDKEEELDKEQKRLLKKAGLDADLSKSALANLKTGSKGKIS